MGNEPGSYADIRQIVIDAVNPIKEQLDRIYDSLTHEFVRKDANDARITAMQEKITDLEKHCDELEARIIGTPQRYLLFATGVISAIVSLVTLLTHLK